MNTGKTHFKKGQKPWNAGTKGLTKANSGSFSQGHNRRVGLKHSEESKAKMRLAKLGKYGENSNNWKGGTYPLNMLIRRSEKYRDWRTEVFKKDGFTCQDCGSTQSGSFEAHHIEAFSVIMQKHKIDSVQRAFICADLWEIKNGKTLCVKCHRKTDTYGNRKILAIK